MACIPYRIDITGTDALLEVDQTVSRRMRLSQDIGHQRVHACRGEQDRGIILRYERVTGDLCMIL